MIDDEEQDDFFDRPLEEEPPRRPEPKVKLMPDDPQYWDQEESNFEHIIPQMSPNRRRLWIVGGAGVLALAIIIFIRIYFFTPYIDEAAMYGYVNDIQRRGIFFKTYEGELLPFRNIRDTTRVTDADLLFTAQPEVAAQLRRMQLSNLPVRVEYKRYHSTLPWRGDSKTVVISVDSVDPHEIVSIDSDKK